MPEALTSYAIVAVCSVLAPAWLGFGCLRKLGVDRSHGLRVAWGYGYLIGHLLLAPLVFLWLVAGQPVPGWCLPVVAAIGGTLLHRSAPQRDSVRTHSKLSIVWIVVPLLVVMVPVIESISRINVNPILLGDESFIWAAKAKVWFAIPVGEIGLVLGDYVAHPDYPMWNPLVQNLAFASVGDVLHWQNRLPVQGFALALLLLLSAALTRRSHALIAAVVLLAFGGTTFAVKANTAGADVMLALSTLACVDALLRAKETGHVVWWRIACCALAGMLASKNEGALLALVVLVAFGLQAGFAPLRTVPAIRSVRRATWLLLPVVVWLAHSLLNRAYELRNDLLIATDGRGMVGRILHQFSDNAPKVWSFFYDYCVDMSRSRWLLPATALMAVVIVWREWRRVCANHALVLVAITWATVCGYALVFIGTNATSLDWHLQTAFDRILLHILPVATLALAMLIWPKAVAPREQDIMPGTSRAETPGNAPCVPSTERSDTTP